MVQSMYADRQQRLPHPRREREPGRRAAVPQPRGEQQPPAARAEVRAGTLRRRRLRGGGTDTTPPDTSITGSPLGATPSTTATLHLQRCRRDHAGSEPDLRVPARRPRHLVRGRHARTRRTCRASSHRLAHLPRAGEGRRRQRRPAAGRLHVDDRPDRARDRHPAGPGCVDDEHECDLPLHVARDRAPRSSARSTRAPRPRARRRRRTPTWRSPSTPSGSVRSTPPATSTSRPRTTRGPIQAGGTPVNCGPSQTLSRQRRRLDRAEQPVQQQGRRQRR